MTEAWAKWPVLDLLSQLLFAHSRHASACSSPSATVTCLRQPDSPARSTSQAISSFKPSVTSRAFAVCGIVEPGLIMILWACRHSSPLRGPPCRGFGRVPGLFQLECAGLASLHFGLACLLLPFYGFVCWAMRGGGGIERAGP